MRSSHLAEEGNPTDPRMCEAGEQKATLNISLITVTPWKASRQEGAGRKREK